MTKSMAQGFSWLIGSHLDDQDIPALQNTKIHHHDRNSMFLDPILKHYNPAHIFITYFSKKSF